MRNAPYLDFPLDEYQRRLKAIRRFMADEQYDLLVLTVRENVEYLCGFMTVSWRSTDKSFWLIVPREGPLRFFADPVHLGNVEQTCCADEVHYWGRGGVTAVDLLADTLKQLGGDGAVGLEIGVRVRINMSVPDYHAVRELIGSRPVRDAAALVGRVRMVKCDEEVRRIRKACEITEQAIGEIFPGIEPGMTERDILRDLARRFLELGADTPLNCNNFGYLGINGGRPTQNNPIAVDRPIQQGDLVRLDGGCVYRGYGADVSRIHVVAAEPSVALRRHVDACNEVMDTVIEALRPGVTSAELCGVAQRTIVRLGYENKQRILMDRISVKSGSMIGHSTGTCMHEDPFITPTDRTVWRENMTGSVEFGLGDDEVGYADFEDNWVIRADGREMLSTGPRLIERVKASGG